MKKTKEEILTLIQSMSPKEKAGQLFLLAYPGKDPEIIRPLIETYGICGCYISQDNARTFDEAESISTKLQTMSLQKQGIPLLLGVDQEGAWGVLVPESHTGPGNMALNAIDDPQAVSIMYSVIGNEMLSVGYNLVLGPCSDVNSNPRSPIIGTRSFGQFPDQVAEAVSKAVSAARHTGILTCLKHFPGHGATSGDTHREIPFIDASYDSLRASDLVPFKAGIDAGAELVMTSHIRYPQIDQDNPATLSKTILQDILRGELGFTGLILSDSMNMGAIRKTYDPAQSTLLALQAGVDIVMLSEEHYDFETGDYLGKQLRSLELVEKAIETGILSEELVTDKLLRILDCKFNAMMLRTPRLIPEQMETYAAQSRNLASQAVSLLQKGCWPLPRKERIICINATPRSSYHSMVNSRGIGPNQEIPAFESFIEEFQKSEELLVLSHEQVDTEKVLLDAAAAILVITEDYPLPGEDFDKQAQQELVRRLCGQYGKKLIIIGLRSPYELSLYPKNVTYLCSYSSRTCSAKAAAKYVLERKDEAIATRLPVSVPYEL
ncbi:MAG: glycoside hydrolase family 3 protein [Sphaerochaeta sp.]|uniref:glycoside hydrolase family 3 protein n=1 Tax=Sphaerochaeta sp. TaxID=1972642 RepID=UPI003D0A033E